MTTTTNDVKRSIQKNRKQMEFWKWSAETPAAPSHKIADAAYYSHVVIEQGLQLLLAKLQEEERIAENLGNKAKFKELMSDTIPQFELELNN